MMKHGAPANLADTIHRVIVENIVVGYARLFRKVQLALGERLEDHHLHYVCDVDD